MNDSNNHNNQASQNGYGSPAGDGYGSYGAGHAANQGSRDYLGILRERIWWIVVTATLVFTATVIYTFTAPAIYQSTSTVQVLRQQDRGTQFEPVVDLSVRNPEDFNTQVRILESIQVVESVASQLREDELQRFMKPYEDERFFWRPARTTAEILAANRKIVPLRLSLMVAIHYRHEDPQIASLIANLFAQEFINHNQDLHSQGSWRAVEDLRARVEAQRIEVEKLDMRLASFKETHKSISFDSATDIDQQELLKLNELHGIDKRNVDEAQTRWSLIERTREAGRPLWEIDFIASVPQVADLLNRRSVQMIENASLAQRYRHRHPRMIAAVEGLEQIERELELAVQAATEGVSNNLGRAKENLRNSEQRINDKREEIIAMQKIRVEYNSLVRNLEVSQEMYHYLYGRMQQATAQATDDSQSARIIDRAIPATFPHTPKIPLNLAFGLFGGVAVGIGLAIILGIVDNKVKTTHDIEQTIGLSLIGVVPRLRKLNAMEKARAVATGLDPHTIEAFRGIHSMLRLGLETKNARCIITTSTISGEGKSFISTNLALTFGAHGERTIIVDADLRMPNVARSLGIKSEEGLLHVVHGERELESVIIRDHAPNVDVLLSGGRTRNPTQVLGSEAFKNIISTLRMRYDKIVIDSPPLAPVSDALTIVPLTDGVIYVLRFSVVKRAIAQASARRLFESGIPVLGAVLNDIGGPIASYYYSHYYGQAYGDYHAHFMADDGNQANRSTEKRRQKSPSLSGR